jgi:hypothetical protein
MQSYKEKTDRSETEKRTRPPTPPPHYAPAEESAEKTGDTVSLEEPIPSLPIPTASPTQAQSLNPDPERIPYRLPPSSPWARFWSNRNKRNFVIIFCVVSILFGTILGAIFLSKNLRNGKSHVASGASMEASTQTVHVTMTMTTVVSGMGRDMGSMTTT